MEVWNADERVVEEEEEEEGSVVIVVGLVDGKGVSGPLPRSCPYSSMAGKGFNFRHTTLTKRTASKLPRPTIPIVV